MNIEELGEHDGVWYPPEPASPPTVRLTVQYREVGPGVDNVELTWETVVPTMTGLIDVLRALLLPTVPSRYLIGPAGEDT